MQLIANHAKKIAAFLVLITVWTSAASAQSKFDPVVSVNGQAISQFEIDQRLLFLKVLRQPGANKAKAQDDLINDKLKLAAARRQGIDLTAEGLEDAMADFAARANLSLDDFLKALKQGGIEKQTLRDFVRANVLWREVVRGRFGSQGSVSEAEVDRTVAALSSRGGIKVAISEIILPAPPRQLGSVRAKAERLSNIRSIKTFAAEARRHSASASKRQSGRLPPVDLSELPAPLQPIIMSLKPGEVTEPIEVPNAILLFQLRSISETRAKPATVSALEYAEMNVPADRARALAGSVDVCDDLYGLSKRNGWPVIRTTLAPKEIEQSVALELAKLDANEVSVSLPSGDNLRKLVMLCGRSFGDNEDVDRDDIRAQLRQRRLGGLADAYLAELRSSAQISR